jgi:hypothetical protein
VYFLGSVVISLVLTHVFGLFTPNSSTYNALSMALSLTGFAFLLSSTPSLELSAVIIFLNFNKDHIEYYLWRAYLNAAASKPTSYYTGKQVLCRCLSSATGVSVLMDDFSHFFPLVSSLLPCI